MRNGFYRGSCVFSFLNLQNKMFTTGAILLLLVVCQAYEPLAASMDQEVRKLDSSGVSDITPTNREVWRAEVADNLEKSKIGQQEYEAALQVLRIDSSSLDSDEYSILVKAQNPPKAGDNMYLQQLKNKELKERLGKVSKESKQLENTLVERETSVKHIATYLKDREAHLTELINSQNK